MKLAPGSALAVTLRGEGRSERPVGRLAWRERRAWFEYDAGFLATGPSLSPFRLPLRAGVIEAPPGPFDGLFGVFDDSLPDGWGRLLQDRYARQQGLSPASLTPLDRLAWVGRSGIGALGYQPELLEPAEPSGVDLDALARASSAILEGEADDVLPELLRLGGSAQGARPKVLVWLRPADGHLTSVAADGYLPVLVKFRARVDPQDAGALEFVYHQMARRAGLEVPEAWLLPSRAGPGWFAVERFDLAPDGGRRHVHSLCGLLHADHRLPSLDYEGAIAATHHLTADQGAVTQLFRRMVFNVLAHNRDDHTKQFAFLMDGAGRWNLAPAFDLTFSAGPGGEHSMAVGGSGRPDRAAMFRVAAVVGIRKAAAARVIDEVAGAVADGLAAGELSAATRARISAVLPRG